MLAAIVAVDIWFFFFHGVAQPLRELAYNPVLMLMVLGLVVIATALHEIGHATATRYGGAEPGDMGVGIYIVWPAFYTDVTDAYRLGRGGRLRTDLGGVYFNGLFVLITAGLYALTGFEPLLILIIVQHMQVIQQMLPFLRLDGYYILSDLVGVPDMFARIKPTLKSAVPGQEVAAEAAELKPWVRRVTLAWVVFLLPVLLFTFGMLIFNLPRMIATAWDSFFVQLDKITSGSGLDVAVGRHPDPRARAAARRDHVHLRPHRLEDRVGHVELVRGCPAPARGRARLHRPRCRCRRLGPAAERRLPADPAGRARNGPGRRSISSPRSARAAPA